MLSFNFYEFERDFITDHELFKRRKKLKHPEPGQKTVQYAFDYSPYLRRFSIFKEDHSKPGTISVVYFSVIKTLLERNPSGDVHLGALISCYKALRLFPVMR